MRLIVAGETRVLVDAGLSAKEIARRLALVGEDVQRLDAVLSPTNMATTPAAYAFCCEPSTVLSTSPQNL